MIAEKDAQILKLKELLKENAERETGCEYCKERKPILNELGTLQIDDVDSSLWFTCQTTPDDIYEEHTKINYCPFCGETAILEKCSRSKSRLPARDFAVACNGCGSSTRRYFSSEREAVEAWNRRVENE